MRVETWELRRPLTGTNNTDLCLLVLITGERTQQIPGKAEAS
jgi:hypothetical protein